MLSHSSQADNTKYKSMVIISLVYLLSQGFLLILTGTWWDDKTWFFGSQEKMWDIALQLGKPTTYFILSFVKEMPEFCVRIFIFVLFYCCALGTFIIYRQLPFVNNKDAVLMALLYAAIPANDARALLSIVPYSLGFFFFIMGFCLLIVLQNKYYYKKFLLRIVVLLTFTCSFILNSNLVFFAIPLMYIFVYLIKNKKISEWYKFLDFTFIPFIYFGIKNICFPAYGSYEGYNAVNSEGIISSISGSILECVNVLKEIAFLWGRYILIGAIFGGVALFVFSRKKKGLEALNNLAEANGKNKYSMPISGRVILMAIGFAVMYLAVFPYKVIGQNQILVGVEGRSSVLIGLGAAIILYAFISWIPYEYLRIFICSVLIICGICHFNRFYLIYQQDYYRQMDLIYELKENYNTLSDKKNVLYLTDYEPEILATRFYSLNSNAMEAFGDQSHFIMNGAGDLLYLENTDLLHEFVYMGDFQMKDYEIGKSDEAEAIIYYHDGIGIKDTFYLKLLELTNYEKFESILFEQKNLDVYVAGDKQYMEIYSNL